MKISPGQIVIAALALLVVLIQCIWMLRTKHAGHPPIVTPAETNVARDGRRAQAPEPPPPPHSQDSSADELELVAPVQEIVGIGAMLRSDPSGALLIQGTVPHSPAQEAGLTGGLVVSKIDDVVTQGLKLNQCVDLIRGAPGTTVRLELIDPRQNETNRIELVRKKVVVTPEERRPTPIHQQN